MSDRPRRAPIARLEPGELRLDGALAHYLTRVLRLREGDAFVAFDPATGREADVETRSVGEDGMRVHVGALREGRAAARGVVWIHALAKADKCDAVVRDATELGATRILVASTDRSVVRLDAARARARVDRWTRIAHEAARQCGRSEAPRVDEPLAWTEALASVGADHARFCLWERATDALGPRLLDALGQEQPLAFACGPEGGLTDGEVGVARDAGWHIVSLGPRILRTETVAAAVLGAVAVWGGVEGPASDRA